MGGIGRWVRWVILVTEEAEGGPPIEGSGEGRDSVTFWGQIRADGGRSKEVMRQDLIYRQQRMGKTMRQCLVICFL